MFFRTLNPTPLLFRISGAVGLDLIEDSDLPLPTGLTNS